MYPVHLSLLVLILNLPFGFWRASVKKYSPQWFLAVHIPVPLVAAARLMAGVGWTLPGFTLILLAFCGGQFLGGAVHWACQRRS